MGKRTCSVEGCGKTYRARGYCSGHYQQAQREDTLRFAPRMVRIPVPAEQRFWAKVQKTEGCWLWIGALEHGYGRFAVPRSADPRGVGVGAHRFAYELLVGPIPAGLTLDHLCRNRACVNPEHLEPVTMRENTLRSPIVAAAINARKTHCKHGHPLAGDNLDLRGGHRRCKTCRRAWERQRYRERKSR